MMKTIMNKVCLLALSLSCLGSSPLVIAQSNSVAALVPVISLLLEEEQEQDPCITPIRVGSVVFGRLSDECPPTSRSDSDAAHYFSFSHAGGPLYIESLSDSPDSFQSTLNLLQGRGRDGDSVTTGEDGAVSSNGFGSGRAISSIRYISAENTPNGLPAGQYTIEVGFRASTSGAQRAFTLSVYGDLVTARPTGRLNDTGISGAGAFFVDTLPSCPEISFASFPQDCDFGRDNDPNLGRRNIGSDSDGHDGFSFLKVGASGEPLPASTDASHACVKDNVTGLMWEVKTDSPNNDGLHDADHRYTWYNSNDDENGGSRGTRGDGESCSLDNCDTESYVAAVNSAGLCGYNDWRMPTLIELQGLIIYENVSNTNFNSLDMNFFPEAQETFFWSSAPAVRLIGAAPALGISLSDGMFEFLGRDDGHAVRLVRDGQ